MRASTPTPQEAKRALAEAARQASWGARADRQYRPILLGVAAGYLAAGVLVGLFPQGGSVFAGIGLILIVVGGLVGTLGLLWRIRAYTRSGTRRFGWYGLAFTIWNIAVSGVSSVTGWWGPHQPGFHFTVSAAIAIIPLLLGAWLVGKWR